MSGTHVKGYGPPPAGSLAVEIGRAPVRRRQHPVPSNRTILVLSGEGPVFKKADYLSGSLLDRQSLVTTSRAYGTPFSVFELAMEGDAARPLLRPKAGYVPHLTTFALSAILEPLDWEFELFDLVDLWTGKGEPQSNPGVVFLSTTFIWSMGLMERAVTWIAERFPDAALVVGGQYSNLKYERIMRDLVAVDVIIRGDGELAIPQVLEMLQGTRTPESVANLVWTDDQRRLHVNPIEYIDLDAHPSPGFGVGQLDVVPYESMRGCPFVCRFCSFPHASPQWRYKSALKIADDWRRYHRENGARHIRAMDSTFTVPPRRLNDVLDLLAGQAEVTWEAYTRANSIRDAGLVSRLVDSGCVKLSIGFESMSPVTLDLMKKKVTARQNAEAVARLMDGGLPFRGSFMVGYPGESPEDFATTADYLASDYAGHFMLSVFSLSDETMPVWEDAESLQLVVEDPDDPDRGWTHVGMTSEDAHQLHGEALDRVRRSNDRAVLLLWQNDYHTPVVPGAPQSRALAIEKAIERLSMVTRDHPDPRDRIAATEAHLATLRREGIVPANSAALSHPLVSATAR